MADGTITLSTALDNKQLEKDLQSTLKKINALEKSLAEMGSGRNALAEQANQMGAQLDAAKRKLYEMQDAAKGVYSKETIADQKTLVNGLQSQWDKINNQIDSYDRKIQKASASLKEETAHVEELKEQLKEATTAAKMQDAIQTVGKSVEKVGQKLSSMLRRVFVFTVLTSALRSLRTWIGNVIKSNSEASASLAQLKAALLTLVQPLVNVIIPAFIQFVNVLTRVVTAIAQIVSSLFGTTFAKSKESAKQLNKETKAIKGVGGAAEKASKQLAAFDEINQLTDNSSGGGGGADAGTSSPDFDALNPDGKLAEKFKDILGLVGAIAAGLLAWKIASAFTNDLSKIAGIALAVAGAFEYVYSWLDAWNNGIDWGNFLGMLGGLAAVAGGLALAFGKVAAGISLIVGGIGMVVVGIKDVIDNGFTLQNTLSIVAGLIASGLGISLLTGNWIPLLISGLAAALVAIVSFTGNGNDLIAGLKKTFEGFSDFFGGVFSGDMDRAIAGLNKIIEGLKDTWNTIIKSIQDAWKAFIDWVKKKNPDLAYELEQIGETVKGVYEGVKKVLKGLVDFISGVFTGDWKKAWEGVKEIFAGVWNGIVSLLEGAANLIVRGVNWLISQLNKISFSIPDWVPAVGGKSFGINIPQLSEVTLPRLATGAVIPPNREFMAVLGDQTSGNNIEAPESLIRQIVREETQTSASNELLREILSAIREGKVMMVDSVQFAKVTQRSLSNASRASGTPLTVR